MGFLPIKSFRATRTNPAERLAPVEMVVTKADWAAERQARIVAQAKVGRLNALLAVIERNAAHRPPMPKTEAPVTRESLIAEFENFIERLERAPATQQEADMCRILLRGFTRMTEELKR